MERRAEEHVEIEGARPGIYVEFESFAGWELALSSLEQNTGRDPHQRVEVVAVRTEVVLETPEPTETPEGAEPLDMEIAAVPEVTETTIQRATVFIPDGKVAKFVKQFEAYASTVAPRPRELRHHNLVDRIASLRLATVEALWTDDPAGFPGANVAIWWEVWLRKTDGRALSRFTEYAAGANIALGPRSLEFDDRIIVLAYGTAEALSSTIEILDDVAEFRKAKELATFFVDQTPEDQADWIRDLLARVRPPDRNATAVTVLDSGVTQGHPLIALALDPADVYAVNPAWGGHDDGGGQPGHGTEMSGLALYGDLVTLLAGGGHVQLKHRLESVKILPPPRAGRNDPDLYGAVMATAVSYPEIAAPARARVFSMSITSDDHRDRGQPTSWSAAVDALSIGRSFDVTDDGIVFTGIGPSRLFVISAGNTSRLERAHLDRSDLEVVEDPAQAWNALTVGACTERAVIQDARFNSWTPLSMPGELSAHSTTSVGFATPWPIKPDIVMEGGNIGINGSDQIHDDIPDLVPLTTFYKPQEKPLVTTSGTSAACASAARLCALVMAEYPTLWPETVRGLVVHGSRWSDAMHSHRRETRDNRSVRAALLRRYGYGIPDEGRVLRSAKDALTLIGQNTIRPFLGGKFRDMHVYELPWPGDVLEALGGVEVRLHVTLSYFIEPNPARRGWQARHRYQSHALRFEVKRPLESVETFRKRINELALVDGEERPPSASDDAWFFGARAREHGSLHSDYWTGTAADLAARGAIGVHPVTGWWKEQKTRDRSEAGIRYALLLSIETQGVETDIWTPVAQQIGVPIEIMVER